MTKQNAWFWTTIVVALTVITIFVGRPMQQWLTQQSLLLPLYWTMLAIGSAYLLATSALTFRTSKQWVVFVVELLLIWYTLNYWTKAKEELLHLFCFGLTGYFLYRALRLEFSWSRASFFTLIFIFIFGFGYDLIKLFVPQRYFGLQDIILNYLSGFSGIVWGVGRESVQPRNAKQ